jgi:hypothetical protein
VPSLFNKERIVFPTTSAGTTDSHRQENEVAPLPDTTYKKPVCKSKNYKTLKTAFGKRLRV